MFGQGPSCSFALTWGGFGIAQLKGFLNGWPLREDARSNLNLVLDLNLNSNTCNREKNSNNKTERLFWKGISF